jgi:predicted MPP superfamily phosphohydrolase
MTRSLSCIFNLLLLLPVCALSQIEIVFTSDVHYGITRPNFQGHTGVPSWSVNERLVEKINGLPSLLLPADHGVGAGQPIAAIDYIMIAGDIANRMESGIQSATSSWDQFTHGWLEGIKLKDHHQDLPPFLLVPGNHDVSDAVGFYRPMTPLTDAASMAGIYNLMMKPPVGKTNGAYRYARDKINYSREIGGIHFVFITIWPDSANRIWMEKDLATVDRRTPVIIVAHDPPEGDAAHFRNPNGAHDINARDRFEGLLEETSKDEQDPFSKGDGKPQNDRIEQEGFVAFLKAHPNIKAYFHGHNNWNQFYTYTGPDGDLHLPVFRVDSPMKGKYSASDETRLSFQLITIDPVGKKLTVRECLWDTDPSHPARSPVWGESFTLTL